MKMQANSIHGIRVVCFETTWTCAYAMCKCVGISISIFRICTYTGRFLIAIIIIIKIM